MQEKLLTNKEKRNIRIHTRQKMINGLYAEVIDYINSGNITVRFEDENKTTLYHQNWNKFKKGKIIRPNEFKITRTGISKKMINGKTVTILEYINASNMTVRIEEDNKILYRQTWFRFKNGYIGRENRTYFTKSSSTTPKIERIGEMIYQTKPNMNAKCIAYRNRSNIDVVFENGMTLYHKSYQYFKSGRLVLPGYVYEERLYETKEMNNGLKATIIDYDIETRRYIAAFENGERVTFTNYKNTFAKGRLKLTKKEIQ